MKLDVQRLMKTLLLTANEKKKEEQQQRCESKMKRAMNVVLAAKNAYSGYHAFRISSQLTKHQIYKNKTRQISLYTQSAKILHSTRINSIHCIKVHRAFGMYLGFVKNRINKNDAIVHTTSI